MKTKKAPILTVDTDTASVDILKQVFRGFYDVLHAETVKEAFKLLKHHSPHCLLIEVDLGDTTGIDALLDFKADSTHGHLPVIIVSQRDDILTKIEAFNNGAIDFIMKPYVSADLKARVDAHVAQFQRQFHSNPLSGLPGSVVFELDVRERMEAERVFTVLEIDLEKLRFFNERYGYDRGDEVILFIKSLMLEVQDEVGLVEDFLGHLGGDDFVYICEHDNTSQACDYLINGFTKGISAFYDTEDRKRGYIELTSRKGEQIRYPMMRMGIAGATNQHRPLRDYRHLRQILDQVRVKVNALEKSGYHIDKRTN